MNRAVITIDAKKIPKERVETMARPVLAAVRAYFDDPKNQREFEEWLAKRKQNAQEAAQ